MEEQKPSENPEKQEVCVVRQSLCTTVIPDFTSGCLITSVLNFYLSQTRALQLRTRSPATENI